jgi:hypothetical protein
LHYEGRNTSAAQRYYYHAIFAADATPESARDIRLELVRMLLAAGDFTRAQSELLGATIDLPDNGDLRIEIAGLFERAGNAQRASEQYRRVLETRPADAEAVNGAVRTAFALENYREVLTYDVPPDADTSVRELVLVSREVLDRDPLAARLAASERRRRALRNIAHVQERWTACVSAAAASEQTPDRRALIALQRIARSVNFGRDSDTLEAALITLDRLRRQVVQRCGDSPVDRALAIIARRHGLDAA